MNGAHELIENIEERGVGGYSSVPVWQRRIRRVLETEMFPEEKLLQLLAEMEERCLVDAWIAAVAGDHRVVIQRMALVDLAEEVRSNGAEVLQ